MNMKFKKIQWLYNILLKNNNFNWSKSSYVQATELLFYNNENNCSIIIINCNLTIIYILYDYTLY